MDAILTVKLGVNVIATLVDNSSERFDPILCTVSLNSLTCVYNVDHMDGCFRVYPSMP